MWSPFSTITQFTTNSLSDFSFGIPLQEELSLFNVQPLPDRIFIKIYCSDTCGPVGHGVGLLAATRGSLGSNDMAPPNYKSTRIR
jgi:hypothetical protein